MGCFFAGPRTGVTGCPKYPPSRRLMVWVILLSLNAKDLEKLSQGGGDWYCLTVAVRMGVRGQQQRGHLKELTPGDESLTTPGSAAAGAAPGCLPSHGVAERGQV